MREMELKVGGRSYYHSQFDETTGTLVRDVELARDIYSAPWDRLRRDSKDYEAFEKRYPRRHYSHTVFSPVPETVDVSITDKCHFGCTYCYQNSLPDLKHGPKDLVETIIKGFDQPPYQIAIGGGEPTLHPDLPYILRKARELGTVPNYTTAGDKISDRVIEATNEVCGGVAMTYHAFKGIDWFVEHYTKLKERLKVQLNVHLIADKDVAKNLAALVNAYKQLGSLSIVLLAYYPEVGRATLDSLITKRVYMKDLPEAIKMARSVRYKIAFSEGLLPYFLSRPELGVETRFAMPSEGFFSCYFNPKGQISQSSFDPPRDESPTAFSEGSQKLWDDLYSHGSSPNGEACYSCKFSNRCSTPETFHYFLCGFAKHNSIPLKELPPPPPKTAYQHLLENTDEEE